MERQLPPDRSEIARKARETIQRMIGRTIFKASETLEPREEKDRQNT